MKEQADEKTISRIKLELIKCSHDRQALGDIDALAENIKAYGLQSPILVVSTNGGNEYLVVDGRRRFEAIKKLGWETVPAITLKPEEATRDLSLIMNTHRLNLNPVELYAIAKKILGDKLPKDPDVCEPDKLKALAAQLNTDIDTAKRIINIGRLHKMVQDALLENKIPLKLALISLRLTKEPSIKNFLSFCIRERPSTREAMGHVLRMPEFRSGVRDLDCAVFNKGDCVRCPNHGRKNPSLFEDPTAPDDNDEDLCFDPACYDTLTGEIMAVKVKAFQEKTGIKNVNIAAPGKEYYSHTEFDSIKKKDPKACLKCTRVIIGRKYSHSDEVKALCPDGCANSAGTMREPRERAAADRKAKDPDKWTRKDKIAYLEERFPIAVRKFMIEHLLEIKKAKKSGYSIIDANFKKEMTPKDTKRILFGIGCLAHQNPFDAIDDRIYDGHTGLAEKEQEKTIRDLDLDRIARANLDDLADYFRKLDRAGMTPQEIDKAFQVVYGIDRWCKKHYLDICTRLSKKSKALLEEIKPWKPDWA